MPILLFFLFLSGGNEEWGSNPTPQFLEYFLHMDIHHYDASKCYKQLCFSCVKYKIEN